MEEVHNPQPKLPKLSYAKATQQPAAAHFQHDPVRAAKKMFQDDAMRRIGSDSSYKGRTRGEWIFDSFHMRVFKWTLDFDPQIESPIAPVWIHLPGLPVHLFEKNALFTLATKIRKPLRMDEPTADLSRPDLARVCVEIDVTSPKVQAVHLQIEGKTYRQQHADVTKLNAYDILVANDVSSYPSHVPESELPNLQQNSGTGHVAEASLEDSNYEDPLIAALLDRNWETDKTCRKEQQHIHIEALESKTNGGDQTFRFQWLQTQLLKNHHNKMRASSGSGLGEKAVNKETGRIKHGSNHYRQFKRPSLKAMEKRSPPLSPTGFKA
ncbi:hypothetical protein Sango_2747900 [Sesamum angolense]|uniref:DUF4283 domain-containing protein n=1 Tax=Sesamum angolense TaxID=2727404 RepID=A0AAE1W118_9LAMI|nr:hypothetical protein Sango_2747900 [Sesamum angolense]